MGIRGLTGYTNLRSSQLGRSVIFVPPPPSSQAQGETVFIVDGNSFVYKLSRHVEWVRGGESATLVKVLDAYIEAFKNVGVDRLVFVWDGPFDLSKLRTAVSRLQHSVRSHISYMRSGSALRLNKGFRTEIFTLPISAIRTCIAHLADRQQEQSIRGDSLRSLAVEQVFAAGEADKEIAEIAIRRQAYILSQDSDFFIIGHGSKGYIPIDSLNFFFEPTPTGGSRATSDGVHDSLDDEWTPVKKGGKASQVSLPATSTSLGRQKLSPALTVETLSLSSQLKCTVYTSTELALQLNVRLSYFPFLAVLCGNDYYSPPIWRSAGSPTGGPQARMRRLDLVAKVMQRHSPALDRHRTEEGIKAFLRKVLEDAREFMISESEMSDIIKRCVDCLPHYTTSALPALLPVPSFISPLSVFVSASNGADVDPHELAKTRLLNAYESGALRREILQVLTTGLYGALPLLEDPDCQSCYISCGRELRGWAWAVLHETAGIKQPDAPEDTALAKGDLSVSSEMSAPDLVDVEETSEPGPEKRVEEDQNDASAARSSNGSGEAGGNPHVRAQPIVTEYVRRSAAIMAEPVAIPILKELVPSHLASPLAVLSRSTKERYHLFLHATSSLTPALAELSGPQIPYIGIITSLRHLALTFEDSRQHRWSAALRRAALAMAYCARNAILPQNTTAPSPPENYHVQRSAQLASTLSTVSMLGEVFLLTLIVGAPERLFEGRLLHAFLDLEPDELDDILQNASVNLGEFEHLVDTMEEDLPRHKEDLRRTGPAKKKDRKKTRPTETSGQAAPSTATVPSNMFELLSLGI